MYIVWHYKINEMFMNRLATSHNVLSKSITMMAAWTHFEIRLHVLTHSFLLQLLAIATLSYFTLPCINFLVAIL